MSTRAGKPSGQSGMTLVELIFVIALLATTTVAISRFVVSTRAAASRQEAAAELQQRSLRIMTNLRGGLQGCVELIADYSDSSGTGDAMVNLRAMIVASVKASSGAPAPVGFCKWPVVTTSNEVDMNGPTDANATTWGNELMYVAQLNPVTFTAYYSGSGSNWSVIGSNSLTSTTAEIVSVPRVQFVYDYLTWSTSTAFSSGGALRLVEWRSQPLIVYSTLSDLSDTPATYTSTACCPRLKAACQSLTTTSYTTAFDPTEVTGTASCSRCFYSLSSESNISGGSPETMPTTLPMGSWAYLDDFDAVLSYSVKAGTNAGQISRAGGNASGQISSKGGYSVAFNVTGTAATSTSVVALQSPTGALSVPAYAKMNYSDSDSLGGTGFPAGFEVAVDGPVNSREIVMRLVLMASNAGNSGPNTYQALQQVSEISVATQSDF